MWINNENHIKNKVIHKLITGFKTSINIIISDFLKVYVNVFTYLCTVVGYGCV